MASSVAGHRRAFGSDTVPGLYEDLEQADLVVLVGSNLAWCHPVLYQRLAAAKEARPDMRVVVVDPRRTASCDIADLHLALAPGSDAALFNALLAEIDRCGATDGSFLENLSGFDAALQAARLTDPAATGLPARQLAEFLDLWCSTRRVVTLYSQGINQSDSGTDKVNAILNCHLATGRIGRPGMGPFSLTGQPNAMGGREVGGLANMLACHLDIENPAHRDAVQGFWNSPAMAPGPGLKAVEMFNAVEEGKIRALWIMCTNPAASMPDADRVARAIGGCDFVVVSDMMADTDTTRLAHVLLPATGWAEKDGTVTNSERRISRQRRLLPAPGQARDDWRIIADVAARMGWAEGFAWDSPAEIFAEHARLSGLAGALGSDFDISLHGGIGGAEYDALRPFLWPQSARRRGGRFFADGVFHTPDGKARMVPVSPRLAPDRPFRLNTGRVRDHWHTMTRTGLSPRLSRHIAEPYLEIHPDDARRLRLEPAGLAELWNDRGRAILRVLVTDRVRPGHPFAPIHWTGTTAPSGRVAALVPPVTDPVSGQPASKSAPVSIRPFAAAWYGFAISTRPMRPECRYWAQAVLPGGSQAELAGEAPPEDWTGFGRALFGTTAEPLVMRDGGRGIMRLAFLEAGRLRAALFVAPRPVALSRSHVATLLGAEAGPSVLAGHPGSDLPDEGATICACFGIGVNSIARAITGQGLVTVEAIGAALRAGTNCGSCRPEIRSLIASSLAAKQAAE